MKELFYQIGLFAVLAVALSGGTSCSAPAVESNATNAAPPANSAGTNTNRSSEYPPLASGLAEAEFDLLDGSGKFKLSEKKGKVLLVNIWGTWCGPCRAEMPHLVELQNQFGANGFEVIGLNIGDGRGTPEPIDLITDFVAKMKLNYTIGISSNQATAQFYTVTKQQVVPQSLLIDRQGHLRGVFVGGGARVINQMKASVAKLMSEG